MVSNCMRIKDTHCCLQSGHCSPRIGHNGIKQFLVSGEMEAQAHQRTYCPTTCKNAEGFYAPGQHSDELVKSGTPAEFAHERVLPVVCYMSNKSSKHGCSKPCVHHRCTQHDLRHASHTNSPRTKGRRSSRTKALSGSTWRATSIGT